MFLVNNFGRVVYLEDEAVIARKLKQKRLRAATDAEIAKYLASREDSDVDIENSVHYQTVNHSPDGYGMSRDHLKTEALDIGLQLSETFEGQKVGLLYNYPYSIASMRTDVRLVYTMFESDKIPQDWPEYLKQANEVIVPSTWCAEVFAKSGITATVVPLGYNDRIFKPVKRPEVGSRPFTFIHYDSFNLRKGFIEVFNAFTKEFNKDDNVRLILKTVRDRTNIPVMKSEYAQIDVIKGMYSEQELVNLLQEADCMVYPSRGEGFGITPLEAMATGCPAIVPNAHGISEYFNPKYMLEVNSDERTPAAYNRYRNQDVGDMVICSVDDLRRQMRYAYEHQDKMRKLGISASEYVKTYTYRHTAEKLMAIVNKWQNTKVAKRADAEYLEVLKV